MSWLAGLRKKWLLSQVEKQRVKDVEWLDKMLAERLLAPHKVAALKAWLLEDPSRTLPTGQPSN